MKPIDAGALMAEMHNIVLEDGEDRRIVYEVIERQPIVDPVKHGHWVWKKPSDDCRCSNCGKIADQKYPYCPWCGARMKGEEDEERLNAIE